MAPVFADPQAHRARQAGRSRAAWADNLKVVLVIGVIVAHVTIAWTGVGNWVFTEGPVREPLFSLLVLASAGSLFGLAVFFMLAGMFTPQSLERKGLRRFLIDRTLRLAVPMLFFIVVLAPFVEWADPERAGWDRGFAAYTVEVVWWSWPVPPSWGPTWFLAVLLLFSVVYALVRQLVPRRPAATPLRRRYLVAAAATVALVSWFVRFEIPVGDEVGRLALGQAPAWVTGFALGVVGAERGWFDPIEPAIAGWARRVGMTAIVGAALVIGVAGVLDADLDAFAGNDTWQSLVLAVIEGVLVVSMPLWLVDVFRWRFDHQGRLAREASRAAFAAFVVHQIVLVGLVLASHAVRLPPEAEWLAVSVLGVLVSFGAGALLTRIPAVGRFV
ncbi:acyltransferase family protein [Pengzhenrongella frigida]|uniref:Acyltransferase n=1 Tax=Pengzhenrongella frigida TaxID=1259133 RepID=A0A4Q5N770_9MICO|nr:acyltransferase [Cellulomonas sp. HLT2-17]RYV52281.1 acyltransferase [Cellulomonas sp. HLT2-17]